MLINHYYDLEDSYDDMLYCFAWNLINIQGMNYTQAARVLGVSSGTPAKKLALRHERNRDRNKKMQDKINHEFEAEQERGLFVWKPLIFSEAMALHKSLNPC
jgi:hypothetical protein